MLVPTCKYLNILVDSLYLANIDDDNYEGTGTQFKREVKVNIDIMSVQNKSGIINVVLTYSKYNLWPQWIVA